MSTIRTSAPLDLSPLTDAVVLPIDDDLRGVYSPEYGVLHIIDVESGIALESFENVANVAKAGEVIRRRY